MLFGKLRPSQLALLWISSFFSKAFAARRFDSRLLKNARIGNMHRSDNVELQQISASAEGEDNSEFEAHSPIRKLLLALSILGAPAGFVPGPAMPAVRMDRPGISVVSHPNTRGNLLTQQSRLWAPNSDIDEQTIQNHQQWIANYEGLFDNKPKFWNELFAQGDDGFKASDLKYSLRETTERRFQRRFGRADWEMDKLELRYDHPDGQMREMAVYFYTSRAGDHNGAFFLDHERESFKDRLLLMSESYNVRFKRVGSVDEAQDYIKRLPRGTKIKHLVLGGHGNRGGLVLGSDHLEMQCDYPECGEDQDPWAGWGLNSKASRILDSLQPMLMLEGEERSRILLDSCLTASLSGSIDSCSPYEMNFAAMVAKTLAGAQIIGFDESIGEIITGCKECGTFYARADGQHTDRLKPFSIMFNRDAHNFDIEQALLEARAQSTGARENTVEHAPRRHVNLDENFVRVNMTFQNCADECTRTRDCEGILFLWPPTVKPDDNSLAGICLLIPKPKPRPRTGKAHPIAPGANRTLQLNRLHGRHQKRSSSPRRARPSPQRK